MPHVRPLPPPECGMRTPCRPSFRRPCRPSCRPWSMPTVSSMPLSLCICGLLLLIAETPAARSNSIAAFCARTAARWSTIWFSIIESLFNTSGLESIHGACRRLRNVCSRDLRSLSSPWLDEGAPLVPSLRRMLSFNSALSIRRAAHRHVLRSRRPFCSSDQAVRRWATWRSRSRMNFRPPCPPPMATKPDILHSKTPMPPTLRPPPGEFMPDTTPSNACMTVRRPCLLRSSATVGLAGLQRRPNCALPGSDQLRRGAGGLTRSILPCSMAPWSILLWSRPVCSATALLRLRFRDSSCENQSRWLARRKQFPREACFRVRHGAAALKCLSRSLLTSLARRIIGGAYKRMLSALT